MITVDVIIENLRASGKKQALECIAEKAAELFFGNPDSVLSALVERERIGSTGIGCGVAIPHVKIVGLKRIYGVLAYLPHPVDFGAIDNQPVDIIFALLAPAGDKTTQHLKALAHVSRFLRDAEACTRIRNSSQEGEIAQALETWIRKQAA